MSKKLGISDNTSSTTISLVEVANALSEHTMDTQARRNMGSAINTIGRVLHLDLAAVPADPILLKALVGQVDPTAHGISGARWRNVKSDLNRALRLVHGEAKTIGLSDLWLNVVAKGETATDKSSLRRWGRFCTARNVAPPGVSDNDLDAFIAHLCALERSKSPQRIADDVARLWNRLAERHPELALAPLTVASRSRTYALPWSTFPKSLEEDVKAYCSPSTIESLFDTDHECRSFSSATTFQYERNLRRLASAMVHAGLPASKLTSLRELVTPSTLKQGLGWLADRNGGEPNVQLHNIAFLCLTIARHWAKLDQEAIETLTVWVGRFRPRHRGMTAKNRERLRQFNGGEVLGALVNLPEAIFAGLDGKPVTPTRARLARDAVMVALLTIAPMRLKNLRHLNRQQHFRRTFSLADEQWELVLKASEVKNEIDLAYPVPAYVMAMIDRYMAFYQPLLAYQPSVQLFPGGRGREIFGDGGGRHALGRILQRHLGIEMNPHLFRHLSAFIFLKANPGQYEPVRRLLGHRNMQTTVDFYASFETDEAMKRFGAILGGYRSAEDEGQD